MKKYWLVFLFLSISIMACNNLLGDKTEISTDSSVNQPDPTAVAIKIMSAAGGSGSEITTSTLTDNTPITLFAISVDADGNYMADVNVTWSIANSLGALSTTTGTSTILTPNAGEGNEVVTATHSELGTDTTGNLAVDFTVSNLAGLEAWFKADFGVTFNGSNEVTTWNDQSLNTNHATQPGASTLRPIYVPTAINNKPALRFDGGDDFLTTGASIVNGTSARTIFIVATNISNTGTYNALLELTDTVTTSGTNYGITTEVAVRISGNRVFNEGIAPGQTKVLTVTNATGVTSSGIETYINGVQSTQASVSSQAINTLTNPAYIGQAAFASSNCNCDIAEIVVYSSLLSTPDRQSVESYLADKYGL